MLLISLNCEDRALNVPPAIQIIANDFQVDRGVDKLDKDFSI